MNEHVQHYLGYLDKEMTIMGILSAFCLAVPSLLVERVFSINKDSMAFDFVSRLWVTSYPCLIAAVILMLIAAMFFYKERSLLAWYYGQTALEGALPHYTEHRIEQWLQEADSWEAWLPYNTAFWISITAAVEFILALLATFVSSMPNCRLVYWAFPVVLLVPFLFWVRRNSIKFKGEMDLPYFRIH
ncbi:MAG TPA: hypothetical protein VMH23_19730 [Bacteroidota bacterium]|nr:hypothetical protein [Bacteroidota bacterium]